MPKVALYSSSNRSRAPGRAPVAGAGEATPLQGQTDGSAAAAPSQSKPPSRLRRFGGRHERLLLVAASGLVAVAIVLGYAALHPVPRPMTQKDIDAAVLHTLETTQLPAAEVKAYETIRPSVVRVIGLGLPREKEVEKDAGKDKAAAPGNDKGVAKAPPQDKAANKSQAPDKGARGAMPNDKHHGQRTPGDQGKGDGNGKDEEDDERGIGTGVVIVDSGIILTNLHVVLGAERVKVRFFDGMESDASIIGVQPEHDLAVLKAQKIPDDLMAATMRSTRDLNVGDGVVAVGFPFGIGPSASAGVVSGLRREYRSKEGRRILTNLIQFDAAANPGNSGGPLVTLDGEVVGIVTGILNPTEQRVFIGIGFAVPIENAAAAFGLPPF